MKTTTFISFSWFPGQQWKQWSCKYVLLWKTHNADSVSVVVCLFWLITESFYLHRVHPSVVSRHWLLFAGDTEDTSGHYLLLIHREDTTSGHYLLSISIVSKDYLTLIWRRHAWTQTIRVRARRVAPCLPTYIKRKCFPPPLGMWGGIWKSGAGAACREETDSWCLIPQGGGFSPSTWLSGLPTPVSECLCLLSSLFDQQRKLMAVPEERPLIAG